MTKKNYAGMPCVDCGSKETHKTGVRTLKGGLKLQRRQCTNCGRTWSDKYTEYPERR